MKLVKTNINNLMKDKNTGAVIPTDYSKYETILQKRQHQEEMNKMSSKVERLEKLVELLLNDKTSST